jgi:hypothetical protein
MWFSLRRTTYVVAGESSEVGNPGTLGMTKRREWWIPRERLLIRNILHALGMIKRRGIGRLLRIGPILN